MCLVNIKDLQYIEDQRPYSTLETLKLNAQQRAEERLTITDEKEK